MRNDDNVLAVICNSGIILPPSNKAMRFFQKDREAAMFESAERSFLKRYAKTPLVVDVGRLNT